MRRIKVIKDYTAKRLTMPFLKNKTLFGSTVSSNNVNHCKTFLFGGEIAVYIQFTTGCVKSKYTENLL
jgi:hypothetical protein